MKGGAHDVNLSSFIALGNQIFGMVPVLLRIVYFVALVVLATKVWKAKGANSMSVTEWAAVAIALGLAMR